MAGLAEFGDEEFVGYTFAGSPPRRPRLWFLDRHLYTLVVWGVHSVLDIDVGVWTTDIYAAAWNFADEAGRNPKKMREMRRDLSPHEQVRAAMPGLPIRYQHRGVEQWSAVWVLTDTVIEHVHTFGDDDTWRLGVWPD